LTELGLRVDLATSGRRVTGQVARARYNPGMYRIAVIALILVLVALQYRLWIADGGWSEVHRVSQQRQALHEDNLQDQSRNEALQAEIDDLKAGESATQGRARADIGMIERDEQFFLTIPRKNDAKDR